VPAARRPHLGIAHVPEGRQVFPSLTVMENLEMGAFTEAGRRNWKDNLERILTWLPVLADRRAQLAGTLSGGEQQMVAVGRGLASSPKAADAGRAVDGARADHCRFHLREAAGDPARHAPHHPARRAAGGGGLESADHGYVLEAGRVVLEGNNQSLRANDRVRQAYLGM
jgi:branched-chain amino acid transport system ATP-binding protein